MAQMLSLLIWDGPDVKSINVFWLELNRGAVIH